LSPILGIWASQNYPRITSSYESIATQTVGAGGAASVTFSSIPQTYKHLQIRGIARGTSTVNAFVMQFNGDTTTANYNSHILYGDGTSALAQAQGNYPYVYTGTMPTSSDTANVFGGNVIDILDYTSTSKNKTSRAIGAYDVNGATGYIVVWSGLWLATPAAITSVTLLPNASIGNFAQYTSFALYGIKG
jgi:hypothetical protein